jgi:Na+/H+ antiporter NhaD/arsenite permease-like protein
MTEYARSFTQNGQYWHLIALSGCVGGCLLPIGNTSGYALMKNEDVTFLWYVRHISGKVLFGWLMALVTYFLVDFFLR